MKPLKKKINNSVFSNDSNVDKVAVVSWLIEAYKHAIGMDAKLVSLDTTGIFIESDLISTADEVRKMIFSKLVGVEWSEKYIKILVPSLVQALKLVTKEGKNIFPEIELIAEIDGSNRAFQKQLLSDWEFVHEYAPAEAYSLLLSLTGDNNKTFASLLVWKGFRQANESFDDSINQYARWAEKVGIM
jgi:hypothetical protein